MSENRRKLQTLLRELFQFDAADLDFGIYAVMNRKRVEVARFIERDILDAIEGGLASLSEAQRGEARAHFEDARTHLLGMVGEAALDPAGNVTPAVRSLHFPGIQPLIVEYEAAKAQLDDAVLSEDLEAQVYNDLYRFFARYYDDGDFIPLRRYGADDKYAVPYNGEEVMLHWANADQYYVKSGEYFTDYRFHLAGTLAAEPAQVVFKLTAATVAQNNVKGEKRFFVLAGGAPVAWDDEGRALTVAFEYRPLTDDEKRRTGTQKQQEKLNAEAEAAILRLTPEPSVRSRLAAADGDAKPGDERTALARHLARYTARNTRDYFIHKDLGRFLERELDFFLGNEVLKVDDISWSQPGQVRRYALRVQTIRDIGRKIIAFLAQIEDFQRKFVVQSDYCVTLDRVPPNLYPEITANDRQRGEWARLYGLELGADADPSTSSGQVLSQHPYAIVDTAFFDAGFKARLLAAFDDLDAACDGVLVHGENFQALRLLTPRYAGQVKCIYIDPPYNTGGDGFIYKDDFRHSSWLTMMESRLSLACNTLAGDGVIFVSIDDNEQAVLKLLMNQLGEEDTWLAQINWKRTVSQPVSGRAFATEHEYVAVHSKLPGLKLSRLGAADTARYKNPDDDPRGPYKLQKFERTLSGARPTMTYTIDTPNGPIQRTWSGPPETYQRLLADNRIVFSRGGLPQYKQFLNEMKGEVPSTLWILEGGYNQHAARELSSLFGEKSFETVKPLKLIDRVLKLGASPHVWVLDFFAGSGTTAHAVIALNRQDGGNRKYILVEMADYFDTVLKPRIQKVAYAADWRDGKPVAGSPGQSHMFHYLRLESYEDTLNNLRFRSLDGPLFGALHEMPDYLLHYMLDYETAGSASLLDVAQFQRPFAYQLNITRQDVTEPRTIDLVATFNFLLGLRVRTIRRFEREGAPVVRVTGEDPTGRRVCVLWRDVPPLEEMEAEKAWLQAEVLAGVAYDRLYINGESALPGSDVLAIEPEFKRLMFEGIR